jgi:hypothetical protein
VARKKQPMVMKNLLSDDMIRSRFKTCMTMVSLKTTLARPVSPRLLPDEGMPPAIAWSESDMDAALLFGDWRTAHMAFMARSRRVLIAFNRGY